jgi:sugar phosphate permease
MIGMVIRGLSPAGIEGFASGVNGIVGQMGASLAGVGIGYLLQNALKWRTFIPLIVITCFVTTLLLFLSIKKSHLVDKASKIE